MGRFALGVVVGVAATVLAFLWLYTPSREPAAAGPSALAVQAEETVSLDIADDRPAPSEPAPPVAQAPAPVQSLSAEDLESREAELTRSIEEAFQLIRDMNRELEDIRVAQRLAAPVVHPMPLPPEFGWVLEDTTGKLVHEVIQREPRDEEWASSMEAQLQRFIYDRPEILGAMGSPTITCRSTRCEVTFINYTADERSLEAAQRLRDDYASSDLPNELHAGMEDAASPGRPGNFWIGEHLEDGVATIFWSLPRGRE